MFNTKHLWIVALFTLAMQVMAQPGRIEASEPKGGPESERSMFKGLDLSEEQEKQINELRLELKKKLVSVRADLQKLQSELKLMIVDEKISEDQIKSQLEKINNLRTQIAMERILHQRKVRSLLNEDQKAQYDQMIIQGFSRKHGPGDMPRMRRRVH